MGLFDTIGGFISKNSSWLKPVLGGVGDVLNNFNQSSARNNYADAVRNSIDYDYNRQKEYNDAVNAYNAQMAQYDAGQRAAAAANANARASAAAATERNRQKAAGRAQKILDKTFGQTMAIWQPYKETGDRVLPVMEGAYTGGAKNLGTLASMLFTPEGLSKISQSRSAAQTDIGLPDYLKRK